MYSAFKFALIRYCETHLICDFEDLRYVPDNKQELIDKAKKYLETYIDGLKKFTYDNYHCMELTERLEEQVKGDFNKFIASYEE